MTFYHYTSLHWLRRIQEDGVILTTDSNVSNIFPNAGPPVVWLTDEAEPTHHHGLEGSRWDKKQVRIEVRVPALRWLDWAPALENPEGREALIRTGGGIEAAQHWYVWPAPIRANRWGEIHTFPYRPDRLIKNHHTGDYIRAADLDEQEGVEPWLTHPA